MVKAITLTVSTLCLAGFTGLSLAQDSVNNENITYDNSVRLVKNLADPYVFRHEGMYYLYGTTDSSKGIKVYISDDLINWSNPKETTKGYALHKSDVWGDKWFWNPEVICHNNTFYMFYTVEERLAVAAGNSPLGPFKKYEDNPILTSTNEITGTGTTSIVPTPNGEFYMFYHAHKSSDQILPRKMVMNRMQFIDQPDGKPDVVKVYGPTSTPQHVEWLKK